MPATPLQPAPSEPGEFSGRIAAFFSCCSHAAVWAGLYVAGAVVCLAQVAGIDVLISPRARIIAGGFVFCTAMAVYILDRVKLRDAWLDPADAHAHPRRYAFVSGHSRGLRWFMVLLLAVAVYLGWMLEVWGAAVPVLAAIGVLVYAGKPRGARPRPKDIVLLKNLYVAAGITGFALLVSLAAVQPGADIAVLRNFAAAHATPLLFSAALLAIRVLADAVLCDLDDEDADRRFGTGTLPIHLGRARAWNVAIALRLGAAAALVVIPVLPWWPRMAWASVTVISSITLRIAAPARVRDWVDARLALEALVVAIVLAVSRSSL